MTISFSTEVKLFRANAGDYDEHGRYQDSAKTESLIYCAVQPASQSDLLSLPEGERTTGTIKIYSETELKMKDRIEHKGLKYEVHNVEDNSALFLPHYKAILTKVADYEEKRKTL